MLGGAQVLKLSRTLRQFQRLYSSASGSHTPEGSFSSRLRQLLEQSAQGEPPQITHARNSFVNAIGLSNPEAKDGVPPEVIAANLCDHYRSICGREEQRKAFLSVLASDLGVHHDAVLNEAEHLRELHQHHRTDVVTLLKSEANLRSSLTPFYLELFNAVARLEEGIKFLVDFRGDLLSTIKSLKENKNPTELLSELNVHLKSVLSQWFSPQLMELKQVTWQSPCDILEKVSLYEAVHPLRHWKDLKHRVGRNRRCFIFTHKAIPREPIVVLHAALTSEPSNSIQTLLNRSLQEHPSGINTAVFYSITSTQRGLSGVELGNYLIRMVAKELLKEFPQQLSNLVTLSPIPGFRKWLDSHLKLHAQEEEGCLISKEELKPLTDNFTESESGHLSVLRDVLSRRDWVVQRDSGLSQAMKTPLSALCARYLSLVKRRGQAMDPVAHFHLHNGASIWRVNWMADTSPLGLRNSYGMMVNYRYNLDNIGRNSDAYRLSGTTELSESIKQLL